MASGRRIGLVSAWASRLGGGVFEAVVEQAKLLRQCGFEPVVFALKDQHSDADRARFDGTEVITLATVGPAMVGFAPGFAAALRRADLSLVHLHGIWMYPSRAASRWAAETQRPYVISPHGMMDRWIVSRGRLKKSIAGFAYERRSWRQATLFHALTGQEAEDILAVTGRANSVVIPNAAPEAVASAGERGPSVVYLGRIHPKKNIHSLIDAWQSASDVLRPLGARLQIAGWGDADDVALLKARIDAANDGGVEFLGPVYGGQKAALLGGARYLALPSYSEGLPMVILEAWAAGTPTLMSQHCHLPEGFAAGAALDCGTNVATIADTLRRGMKLDPSAWAAMSQAATTLARHNFSRSSIAERWSETYQRLIADHAAKATA